MPEATPPSLRTRLLAYTFFVGLTCAVLTWGLRLDRVDLCAPFTYVGDTLLILPMVQSLQEHDTHWHADRLGFPGRLELYDFPVIDHLHFACLWVLVQLSGSPVIAFNVYFLLGYPLATLTAMAAGRRLGLSLSAAGGLGVLFAFLPYHQVRGTPHYFLSAYYLIPPVVVWCIEAAQNSPMKLFDRAALQRCLLAAIIGCAGAYYAFFSCVLLAFAGVYGSLAHRARTPILMAGSLAAIIVAVGVANHLPSYRYHATHGRHTLPTERLSFEAEHFALKWTQMMLPIADHRVRVLADLSRRYEHPLRPVQNENVATPLGFLGGFGLLVGLFAAFLPGDRWGIRSVGVLLLFALLFGTVGGFGSLFNFLVTPQVRAVNRISIFIAFGALYLTFRSIDRFYASRVGLTRRFAIPAMLVWTALGIADQTEARWFTLKIADDRDATTKLWYSDAEFFRKLEEAAPGATVFTLPYVPYPETHLLGDFHGYSQARGFVHAKTMKFSFGAMRGRDVDQLHRELAASSPDVMVKRLVFNGFDLVFLDRRGFTPDIASRLESGFRGELGLPLMETDESRQLVFDLRPLKSRMERDAGEAGFRAACDDESLRVRMTWLEGFENFEPLGREYVHIWCRANGTACLNNPGDRPRTVSISMVLQTQSELATPLTIDAGDLWRDRVEIFQRSGPIEKTLTLPPGRTFVNFRCKPAKDWRPTDERRHVFYAAQIQVKELK